MLKTKFHKMSPRDFEEKQSHLKIKYHGIRFLQKKRIAF